MNIILFLSCSAIGFIIAGGVALYYNMLFVGGGWLWFGGVYSAWLFHEMLNRHKNVGSIEIEDKANQNLERDCVEAV